MPPQIWYIYPYDKTLSFRIVGDQHVEILRQHYPITVIHERTFLNIVPYSRPIVLVHPFFYPLMTIWSHAKTRLIFFKTRVKALVGVDVADSDHISREAVELANICDAFIVNSEWSRRAYVRSGVLIPVYEVPHFLRPEFYLPPQNPKSPILNRLKTLKEKYGLKIALFFLWHSGYRKGGDLVIETMRKVQRERKDIFLAIKIHNIYDGVLGKAKNINAFIVQGWFDTRELVALYDLADIVLLFSRGGSFELNGLEALARGKILVAPEGGAWEEYIPKPLHKISLVPARRKVPVLPGNKIHDGKGSEIDVDKASERILWILDNFEKVSQKFRQASRWVRDMFSKRRVERQLLRAIEEIDRLTT